MGAARILVTGATGFAGGHLARRLARDGHAVRALVRDPGAAEDLAREGIEIVPGDLAEPGSLDAAMGGVELVYHLAAAFRQERVGVRGFQEVNVEGTRRMLSAAASAGATRFVHCSTVGVHGHITDPPASEHAPFAPGDDYQSSKCEGERIARTFMDDGRIGVTIFRPAGIYGPGDMRFLKLFRAIKRKRFAMLGRGEVTYHLTYIDDLVDGIVLCGTHPQAVGESYILAGPEYTTLNELVAAIAAELGVPRPRLRIPLWPVYGTAFLCEMLCRPLGVEPPLYRRRVDFFVKSRAFDISKAVTEIGYRPKIAVREGVRRTAEWYATRGLL